MAEHTRPPDAAGEPVLRSDRARRVAGVLRRQILLGAFPSGVLPDERVLVADFGASRNAVREALKLLSGEGLVARRRGIGTVVTVHPYRHPLDQLAGLAEALQHHGAVVNRVRVARALAPPPDVAHRLRLGPGERAVYLERLRLLEGEPVSLDCTYLAPVVGAPLLALPRETLEQRDVFQLIETVCGLALGEAELAVQAVSVDPATAEILAMPASGALFLIERLTRLADGRPVDLEYLHLRGDRMSLHGVLARGDRKWRVGAAG
jgi:GntR family transcriptional regulator